MHCRFLISRTARGACLALLGTLAVAAMNGAHAAAPASTDPAEEIRQIEKDIAAVYAANDLPRYFAYYADDARLLFPEGPSTMAGYRTMWADFIRSGGAIKEFTLSDLVVQLAPGNQAAVASYRAHVLTKNPGAGVADENYLETDVFFRRDGKWIIVEVHYSLQPPAAK